MQKIHGILGHHSNKLEMRKEKWEGRRKLDTKGKKKISFYEEGRAELDLLIADRVPGTLQKLSHLLLPTYSK